MTKTILTALAADIADTVRRAKTIDEEFSGLLLNHAYAQYNMVCRVAPQFNPKFNALKFCKACGL